MKEYLFLLRGKKQPPGKIRERQNKVDIDAWMEYFEKLEKGGKLVHSLSLAVSGRTITASNTLLNPVSSTKEGVIEAYLVLKAESLEAATDLARNCPHITDDGNIEIREIKPMLSP